MRVKARLRKSNAEGVDVNSTPFKVYDTNVTFFFSVLLLANPKVSEKPAWISARKGFLSLAAQNREQNGKEKAGAVTLH